MNRFKQALNEWEQGYSTVRANRLIRRHPQSILDSTHQVWPHPQNGLICVEPVQSVVVIGVTLLR